MHVVITDNSQTVLNVISKQLSQNGHSVTTFSDGEAALNYINSDKPMDILLTGLELSNISGLELCWAAESRDKSLYPSYIIVMSSSSNVDKLIEALDSGADDFLKKPFVEGELLARFRAAERSLRAQRELARLAATDPLTGIANRRTLFSQINSVLKTQKAKNTSKMIMLDIDHFKKVNDDYGHDAGDVVLQEISKKLYDDKLIFGRVGGEKFAAFLPSTSADDAKKIAEEMRNDIADLSILFDGMPISVTCSLGISEQNDDDTIDSLLKRAGQSLYAAKNAGHNRTIMWGTEEHHSCIEDSIYA